MHSKIQFKTESHPSESRLRPPAMPASRQVLLNPPPPDVCAQCARDNERRMRLHAASLFARRNHCD